MSKIICKYYQNKPIERKVINMTDQAWPLASNHILHVEGGWVDDKSDPGGATNYGISLRFLKAEAAKDSNINQLADVNHDGDIDYDDIKALPKANALLIYKYAFWIPGKYDQFTDNIAVKLLDMAVNLGPQEGNIVFQKAINAMSITGVSKMASFDGIIGPQTMSIYNVCLQQKGEEGILEAIRLEQKARYDAIIAANPSLEKFRQGWYNRIASC
jgi:lysozyme family protein